ncbi:hypothetical protein [Nocardioides sp. AN3]
MLLKVILDGLQSWGRLVISAYAQMLPEFVIAMRDSEGRGDQRIERR